MKAQCLTTSTMVKVDGLLLTKKNFMTVHMLKMPEVEQAKLSFLIQVEKLTRVLTSMARNLVLVRGLSHMAKNMKAKCLTTSTMAKVSGLLLMKKRSTMVHSFKVLEVAQAMLRYLIPVENLTKVPCSMARRKAKAFGFSQMAGSVKASGTVTSSMAQASGVILMERLSKQQTIW
jgi:nitrate reductase beta subunit